MGGGGIKCLIGALINTPPLTAQSLDPFRDYEPVVIEGERLSSWVATVDIDRIALYRYESGSFTAIPFQIDKRRKINMRWNASPPNPQNPIDNCEYGYFEEIYLPPTEPQTFASDLLQLTDEIVFMLKDSGATRALTTQWHPEFDTGNVTGERYEIVLDDPVNAAKRYVYAYRWTVAPTDLSTVNYVKYTRDPAPPSPPDPMCDFCPGDILCQDSVPSTIGRACGTAESQGANLPGLATLKTHFMGNWITNDLIVKAPGGDTPYCTSSCDDMLERIHYFEDGFNEQDLSTGASARFLGVSGDPAQGGEIEMPVRVIRGIQGARSGVYTTKYEFIYPTQLRTRINLRVHPGVNNYKAWHNHDAGIVTTDRQQSPARDTYVWSETQFGDPDEDGTLSLDLMDGLGPPSTEFMEPSPEDWTEVASERRGTYVHLYSESRRIPSNNRVYTYKDIHSPPQNDDRGIHGRRWAGEPGKGIGNTADGNDNDGTLEEGENDGGCPATSDPESEALNFARQTSVFVSHELRTNTGNAAFVVGDAFNQRQDQPVLPTAARQIKDGGSCCGGPPCAPTLAATDLGTGKVNLVITKCPPVLDPVFHRIYRGPDSGPLHFLTDLGTATTWTDAFTVAGQTYRYAARSYYEDGSESGDSNIVTVAVTDTTAPATPTGFYAVPGDGSADLYWQPNWTRDTWGYNVYKSTIAGGPYSKQNSTPILAGAPQHWTVAGLTNGQSYYFVITAVDFSANESVYSTEVVVVPGP